MSNRRKLAPKSFKMQLTEKQVREVISVYFYLYPIKEDPYEEIDRENKMVDYFEESQ